MQQFVDPIVTKVKFDKEIQEFKDSEDNYREMGVISTKILYPYINLIFAIPHLKPQPIAFAVKIDFTNWDAEPPSIKFIDPFTEKVLKDRKEIMINFIQVKDKNAIKILPNGQIKELDLLQGGQNTIPFFCIPGVKEYHQHPAHSGDSWMLYRTKGEGKLCVLINQLYRHSIAQSAGYQFNVRVDSPLAFIATDINKLKL